MPTLQFKRKSIVFQLEFSTRGFEVEGDQSISWFGIATGAARPRRRLTERGVRIQNKAKEE